MIDWRVSWNQGRSLELLAHEWAEDVQAMGWAEDWDGSDRPGLPVVIAEDLPSNELPVGRAWDVPWPVAETLATLLHRSPVECCIGIRAGALVAERDQP